MKHNKPETYQRARELRNNPTPAEHKLWQVLRKHQRMNVRFRRQHPISPYVVDFCAPRLKLIIEVDGGQHMEQKEYDRQRTIYLESKGYQVLRFWNSEVMKDLNAVVIVIEEAITKMK
jgi:very-short-patch-repair endonuclease